MMYKNVKLSILELSYLYNGLQHILENPLYGHNTKKYIKELSKKLEEIANDN